jgi:hypothetical protein
MRAVQMKPIQGLLWVKELRVLKTVPMGTEAGIQLTHHPMELLHKELPGLLLEPLHCHNLYVFVQPESMVH